MTVQVETTRLAAQQIASLRGRVKSKFNEFLNHLTVNGCAALAYRLTGDTVERLCVRHFHGAWRVVVAFRDSDTAVILLVAPHDRNDPGIDVYTMLYDLAGVTTPPATGRSKPPCCGGDALPPIWEEPELGDLVQRARELVTRRR
ncbi:hypothetical protein [Kibdelosporangium aridum]|uniref:hypothetical protein n=1 Tax=Kibdelosporangium aridum TaxID=2030 RepID=UPI000F788404|nr:hypothetical protein [Kibdelosporangium aridum]